MPLRRDPNTGEFVWPGRARKVLDSWIQSGALQAWENAPAGTLSFENANGANSRARARLTTAAPAASAAAWRATIGTTTVGSPSIAPANFTFLALTMDELEFDQNDGFDFYFGFSNNTGHGRIFIKALNGTTQAVLETTDSAGVVTDTTLDYVLKVPGEAAGGISFYRNLTFAICPHGFGGTGDQHAWAFVVEDDQVFAAIDLTTLLGGSLDLADALYPQVQLIAQDGSAHSFSWTHARLVTGAQ